MGKIEKDVGSIHGDDNVERSFSKDKVIKDGILKNEYSETILEFRDFRILSHWVLDYGQNYSLSLSGVFEKFLAITKDGLIGSKDSLFSENLPIRKDCVFLGHPKLGAPNCVFKFSVDMEGLLRDGLEVFEANAEEVDEALLDEREPSLEAYDARRVSEITDFCPIEKHIRWDSDDDGKPYSIITYKPYCPEFLIKGQIPKQYLSWNKNLEDLANAWLEILKQKIVPDPIDDEDGPYRKAMNDESVPVEELYKLSYKLSQEDRISKACYWRRLSSFFCNPEHCYRIPLDVEQNTHRDEMGERELLNHLKDELDGLAKRYPGIKKFQH